MAWAAGTTHADTIAGATQPCDPQTSPAQHPLRVAGDSGGDTCWGLSRCGVRGDLRQVLGGRAPRDCRGAERAPGGLGTAWASRVGGVHLPAPFHFLPVSRAPPSPLPTF